MPTTTTADHYRVLGVERSASADEIRAAYRRAMLDWHPDVNRLDPEQSHRRAVALNAAYAVLGDPILRAAYDRTYRPAPEPEPEPEEDLDDDLDGRWEDLDWRETSGGNRFAHWEGHFLLVFVRRTGQYVGTFGYRIDDRWGKGLFDSEDEVRAAIFERHVEPDDWSG